MPPPHRSSDGHDVLVLAAGVGHPLVAHAHLGEVEPADLCARPEGGREPDGHAGADERAVDLPRAQARSHAPDVLKIKQGRAYYDTINVCDLARLRWTRYAENKTGQGHIAVLSLYRTC